MIENCTIDDVDAIYNLYENAREIQTIRKVVIWPYFEKDFIAKEIAKQQQWKLIMNGEIACNWTITFLDPEIWEKKDKNDAIYIHRLVTNPKFRGNDFVKKMVNWAKIYAAENNKQFVRLDTLGNNTRLIAHYVKCGFNFLGIVHLANTTNLPIHYQLEPDCCLFQIKLQ